MNIFRRLWERLTYTAYQDGITDGVAVGQYLEEVRVRQELHETFADLPSYSFSVSKPNELGEYLIDILYPKEQ
jgi:hypothetical protein